MAKYRVNWERHVNGPFGQFHLFEGETAELTDEAADFIQRDSDGILTRVADETPIAPMDDASEIVEPDSAEDADELDDPTRAPTHAPQDRMQRGKVRRHQDRHGDPKSGSTGPITSADHSARKG